MPSCSADCTPRGSLRLIAVRVQPDTGGAHEHHEVTASIASARGGTGCTCASWRLSALERGDVANVSHVRARSATIRTKSGKPEHVLIDGDDAGETPIDIGPIAGHVQVLVPE